MLLFNHKIIKSKQFYNLTLPCKHVIILRIMSGEGLGNGYRMEQGEIVADANTTAGLLDGVEKAIRAKKSQIAVEHMRSLVQRTVKLPQSEETTAIDIQL